MAGECIVHVTHTNIIIISCKLSIIQLQIYVDQIECSCRAMNYESMLCTLIRLSTCIGHPLPSRV